MSTLNAVKSIEVHDMWIADALLHPGFRGLSFIPEELRDEYKNRRISKLGRLLKIVRPTPDTELVDVRYRREPQLSEDSFDIYFAMDYETVVAQPEENDELARYFIHFIT